MAAQRQPSMARCSDCQKKHEDLFEIYKTEIDFMQQMLVGFFFLLSPAKTSRHLLKETFPLTVFIYYILNM